MTVAITVKVSEGLVLAADSALVVEGEVKDDKGQTQQGVLQVYSHATKVTQVRNWPVGTVTWGLGQIGSRTVESLVKEFANGLSEQQDLGVREIADSLHEFLEERWTKQGGVGALGLQVAGYSPGKFFPEQYLLTFPPQEQGAVVDARPDNPDGSPNFGANWYGLTDAIVRLHLGFERKAVKALMDAGVDETIAAKIRGFEYPVIFEAMPLQDAIDFAAWLAEVVIGRFRFVIGPAKVVGPVDIAIITRDKGLEWIRRKTPQVSPSHPFIG